MSERVLKASRNCTGMIPTVGFGQLVGNCTKPRLTEVLERKRKGIMGDSKTLAQLTKICRGFVLTGFTKGAKSRVSVKTKHKR